MASPGSDQLRQQGNALYKQGKIPEAIRYYQDATKADPSDPTPLSNLTAALYESGQYDQCIFEVQKALQLAAARDNVESAFLNKLKARRVRACVMLGDLQKALDVLKEEKELNEELSSLHDTIQSGINFHPSGIDADEAKTRTLRRIVNDLPRYKPVLLTNQEYYSIGHDSQESSFKPKDALQARTSYLYAGIGDARNMHATWLDIYQHEAKKLSRAPKAIYHFTIIDTKAAVLARAIVIFVLLEELADASAMSKAQQEDTIGTLFYVYINHIMPPQAWKKLQSTISKAIDLLDKPLATFTWFDVLQKDREPIKQSLKSWQKKPSGTFSTHEFRTRIKFDNMKQQMNPWIAATQPDENKPPKGCAKDKKLYDKAGVVIPPPSFSADDPIHVREMVASSSFPKNIKPDWLAKLDDTWMPNVTLLDMGHINQQLLVDMPRSSLEFDLSSDLFEQWSGQIQSSPRNPTCLYDYAASYFTKLAMALRHLKGRLRVEPILGEMGEVLEKIKLDLYKDRTNKPTMDKGQASSDDREVLTEDYPTIYDRVHLSNVPDYIGGTLGALLFAAPITQITSDGQAHFEFTCLRNPPVFNTVDHFNNEYCLLPDGKMIGKVFPCMLAPPQDAFTAFMRSPGMNMMGGAGMDMMGGPGMGLIGEGYMKWSRLSATIPFKVLLDRQSLTAWVHGFLLKTAIPVERDVPSFTLVNSPLNLTALFRILLHLKDVGYPRHWLSDILSSILSSPLETRASPPQSLPLATDETWDLLDKSRPTKKVSIKPFVTELTILTTMWLPVLGFGLLKGEENLPDPKTIRKYSIDSRQVDFDMGFEATFVLVFVNMDFVAGQIAHTPLRPKICAKYNQASTKAATRSPYDLREKGLHILTSWRFETETKRATFWMREDVMKAFEDGRAGWHAGIWRSDQWELRGGPVRLAGGGFRDLGVSWAD